MPNDPERPIEKVLRACARHRGESAGPPLELHPANRRLLQGEVVRRFGRPTGAERSFLSVWLRLWPGLGWSLATLTALGLAAVLMLPSSTREQKPTVLAMNDVLKKAEVPQKAEVEQLRDQRDAVAQAGAKNAPTP